MAALVQHKGQDSKVVTFDAALTNGTKLVAYMSVWNGSCTSVSDSAGHVWTPLSQIGPIDTMRAWTAPNTGTTTPTVTFVSADSDYAVCHVSEWSGLDDTTLLDVTPPAANSGTGAAASSGDITPVTAGAVLFAAMHVDQDGAMQPEAGWTELYSYENFGAITTLNVSYKIQGSIATEDCDWTNPSGNWFAQVFALRPSAGGGGDPVITGRITQRRRVRRTQAGALRLMQDSDAL